MKKLFIFLVVCLTGMALSQAAEAVSAVLGVTQITATRTYAVSDGTYENGWQWVFAVTVPDNELVMEMRFADWSNGSQTIPAAGNIRFYSEQSSNAYDSAHAVTIGAAGEYSGPMNLLVSRDLSVMMGGRQIEIVVEARIPNGSVGGSYSTSYGIKSSTDAIAPVITLRGTTPVTHEAGATYSDAGATALDNVDGDLTSSISLTGSVVTDVVGKYEILYSVRDAALNLGTATRTVNVVDTTNPTIIAPPDIELEATGPATAVSLGNPTVSDNVKAVPRVTNNAPALGFPVGTTTVIWTAADATGNDASDTQALTITDKTKPAITVPSNITKEASSAAGATVEYSPSANDVVDGSVAVSCSRLSGSTFALGTTTVTCSATDTNSNTASASFNVTVQDTTAPAITGVPADLVVEASLLGNALVPYSMPTATDLVDGTAAVNCSPFSGSTFPYGLTTVSCSATDSRGNSATATFKVTVRDTITPIVTIGSYPSTPTNQDILVTATTNEGTLNAASYLFTANGIFTFTATDIGGNKTSVTVEIKNIDKTAPVITIGDYPTAWTNQTITVTAVTDEGTLNETTHTFTANGSFNFDATDDAGNKTTKTVTIGNIDKTDPTGTLVINGGATHTNTRNVTLTITGTDNSSGIVEMGLSNGSTYTWSIYEGTKNWVLAETQGEKEVRVKFRDAAGNETNVGILDTIILDLTPPAATVSYDKTGQTNTDVVATLNPSETVNVTSEGGLTHTFAENGIFTFTFADLAGNPGTATANVNNIDKIKPVITIVSYNQELTNQDITVTATTNEGMLNYTTHTFVVNSTFAFTATDAAGNVTTELVTITNIDKTKPTLTITGFLDDSAELPGDLDSGYTLHTENVAGVNHNLKFKEESVASENLKNETFGLYLVPSGTQTADLIAYYSTKPASYQAYLEAASAGTLPFSYIKGSGDMSVRLLDGAQYFLSGGSVQRDMVVPDNFPLGTYTVTGKIKDLAGNEQDVTLKLIVAGSKVTPIGTITYDPADLVTPTRGPITATLNVEPGVAVKNNGESKTYIFNSDGSFTFIFESPGRAIGTATASVSNIDRAAPAINVTGFTADSVAMASRDGGYVLETNNVPSKEYLLQYADGTVATETLAPEYFPLTVVSSTVSRDVLKNYYDSRGVPEPFLAHLKSAADGTGPFAFINGSTVKLVDGARHLVGLPDSDMAVPGDFPLGTYEVSGVIRDIAGNETTVTYKLIVAGDRIAPVITVNGANPAYVIVGSTYADPGATAADETDPTVPVTVTGSVNAGLIGVYTLTYAATDDAENTATATRTVNVVAATQNIVVSYSTGGRVSVVVNSGDSATFAITPDVGYHIVDVKVDNVSVGPVPSYTFHNVYGEHSIYAEFALDPRLVSADITSDGIKIGNLAGAVLATNGILGLNHVMGIMNPVVSNGAFASGSYGFSLQASLQQQTALLNYFSGKGWPSEMITQITREINSTSPFFYLKIDGDGKMSLEDAFQKDLLTQPGQPLVINDDYPAGTYTYSGTVGTQTVTAALTVIKPTVVTSPVIALGPIPQVAPSSTLLPESPLVASLDGITPITVTLTNSGTAYAAVRFGPVVGGGEHVQLWAKDTSSNWYDITKTGWGPLTGFPLPPGYSMTTEVYPVSDEAGSYTLTLTLVDVSSGNSTLVTGTGMLTVAEQ